MKKPMILDYQQKTIFSGERQKEMMGGLWNNLIFAKISMTDLEEIVKRQDLFKENFHAKELADKFSHIGHQLMNLKVDGVWIENKKDKQIEFLKSYIKTIDSISSIEIKETGLMKDTVDYFAFLKNESDYKLIKSVIKINKFPFASIDESTIKELALNRNKDEVIDIIQKHYEVISSYYCSTKNKIREYCYPEIAPVEEKAFIVKDGIFWGEGEAYSYGCENNDSFENISDTKNYLKIMAETQYFAQCGLPINASYARISPVENIDEVLSRVSFVPQINKK